MSENATETTTDETPEAEPTSEEQENGSQAPDPNKSLVEANAKYVSQRDEARAERDAARERVAALQTREVEFYAGQTLADPSDLLALSGLELGELLTEDGYADPEKIRVAAAEILASRPGLRKISPAFDPAQGLGGKPPRSKPSFGDLLK